jgi:hypothetical protein
MLSNTNNSSSKAYLLPLHYVKKTTRKSLNEKSLIVILFISTVITLFIILNNLPSNVNLNDENIKRIFLPKLNKSANQFIHNDDQNDVRHHEHPFKKIATSDDLQIQPIEAPKIGPSVAEKREKIRSVSIWK